MALQRALKSIETPLQVVVIVPQCSITQLSDFNQYGRCYFSTLIYSPSRWTAEGKRDAISKYLACKLPVRKNQIVTPREGIEKGITTRRVGYHQSKYRQYQMDPF